MGGWPEVPCDIFAFVECTKGAAKSNRAKIWPSTVGEKGISIQRKAHEPRKLETAIMQHAF